MPYSNMTDEQKEHRKAYMREYMRMKRAENKENGIPSRYYSKKQQQQDSEAPINPSKQDTSSIPEYEYKYPLWGKIIIWIVIIFICYIYVASPHPDKVQTSNQFAQSNQYSFPTNGVTNA